MQIPLLKKLKDEIDEEIPKTSPTFSITVACLEANSGKTVWSKVHHGAGAIGSGVPKAFGGLPKNRVYAFGLE